MIRFLQTPGPIKKVVFGGLLIILCLAMLVYLIPGGMGSSSTQQGVVATVAGENITTQQVQQQAQQMIQRQFPQGAAQAQQLMPFFAGQAAQQLIGRQALVAEAHNLGLHVTDAELRDELQNGPYGPDLFPKGKFVGQDQYQSMLENAGLTVPQFEDQVRDQILITKLESLVTQTVIVSDEEVHKQFDAQNTKVKFDYAFFTKDALQKTIHPTNTELQAFYNQNKANYANSIPEQRKLEYVLIDTDKVASQIPVSQDDVVQYYDSNRDQYRTPERVDVRHILIKTPLPGPNGKVDEKGVEAARKKAEDILKQLKSGANFATLAKKYSEDPGSAKNGGSLGWIERGQTVPQFESVAFSLPVGQTSGVVQSSYGFHIIQVMGKQQAEVKPLDEVKDQIVSAIRQQRALEAADDQARQLLQQAQTTNLDQAATAKGLQVVKTDFVNKTDSLPGIGNAPQFMSAVFSESPNAGPDESQVQQGFVVFHVLAIKPAATPSFDQIQSRVQQDFLNQRASQLLTQKTQDLADRAKAEHDLKKAAKELGATLKTSDYVLPTAQVPDLGAMSGGASVAFTLKPGEISGPINDGNTGAVLSVIDKQAPTDADFAAKKDEIRDSIRQQKESDLFNLFAANLRDQMEKSGKIKINEEEYKSLTRASSSEEGE
jgi:peptidyl-prolyl cis-trans isomerase D